MNWHRLLISVMLVLVASVVVSGAQKVVVYTYDSFVSWGPAEELEKTFEGKYDCDLEFVTAGAAKATLSRLLSEQESGISDADVFMAEINEVPRIADYDLFLQFEETDIPNMVYIPEHLRVGLAGGFIPYEYGYITITYDSEKLSEEELPQTLEDIADSQYRKLFVCEDPRTSSTGFSFLLWTISRFGEEGYLEFWRSIDDSLLTITSGWSEAWSLLTHGEAPMIVSFCTDTAYGAMYEDSIRYKAFAPGGQGYRTSYGVGIVRQTDQPELAKAFVDLLLSKEIQELLPRTEIMLPVNAEAELPSEYEEYLVTPEDALVLPLELVGERMGKWLHDWEKAITTQ